MNKHDVANLLVPMLDDMERQLVETQTLVDEAGHAFHFDMFHWIEHIRQKHYGGTPLPSYVKLCDSVGCLMGHLAIRIGWPSRGDRDTTIINGPHDDARLCDFSPNHPLRKAAEQSLLHSSNVWSLRRSTYITCQEALELGEFDERLIPVDDVMRLYLGLPEWEYDQLTLIDRWPEPWQSTYRELDDELERVRLARQYVQFWAVTDIPNQNNKENHLQTYLFEPEDEE